MQESSLEGFIKDDNGYSLHLDKLPDSELEFSLSTAEKSKRESSIYTLLILALLLAPILYYFIFVVCFVLLIILTYFQPISLLIRAKSATNIHLILQKVKLSLLFFDKKFKNPAISKKEA